MVLTRALLSAVEAVARGRVTARLARFDVQDVEIGPTRIGVRMIARIWHGWAPHATADGYQQHYESEVSEHLRSVDGFRGARLLRRNGEEEVMFTSITWFTSVDAVRGFAGDDYEKPL
jgi:hypothetical protein